MANDEYGYTRLLEPSVLHRVLRLELGRVPRWFYSGDCLGFDLSVVISCGVLGLTIWLWNGFGITHGISGVVALGSWHSLLWSFDGRERFARARRRRNECVACGHSVGENPLRCCRRCGYNHR